MRRIWSARRGPVVFVSACLFALAGCRGSDPSPAAPNTMHPGTAVTPTTSTPTGDPTDIAAAAAIAAVQRWKDAFNSSIRARSSAEYRTTFTNECTICRNDAKVTDAIYKKGERIVGGNFHVSDLRVVWNKADLVIVQGRFSADPLTVRKGTRVVDRDGGLKPFPFAWKVKPVSGQWLVTSVDALK
jgi:hypothetical protein